MQFFNKLEAFSNQPSWAKNQKNSFVKKEIRSLHQDKLSEKKNRLDGGLGDK